MNKRSKKVVIKLTPMLDRWFRAATLAYDQTLYYHRQIYFANERTYKEAKEKGEKPQKIKLNEKDVEGDGLSIFRKVKQKVLEQYGLDIPLLNGIQRRVKDDIKTHLKALKAYSQSKDGFTGKPKFPYYKFNTRNGKFYGYATIRACRGSGEFLSINKENRTFCIGKATDRDNRLDITVPDNIDFDSVDCVRLVRRDDGKVDLIFMFEREAKPPMGGNMVMGIDIGVDNIIAATINGKDVSVLIKGGTIKSFNQFYNKRKAEMQTVLSKTSDRKVSKRMHRLTAKRNAKIDYELHCISRRIVSLAKENDVGRIVIGHNTGWKQNVDMGRRNNQKFVQIPFNKLISLIRYKAEDEGIAVDEVQESYTSKVDHLALETIKHHETYLGKRVNRGLFVSSSSARINADINGAIGILRVGKGISDEQLKNCISRKDIISPCPLMYKPPQNTYKGFAKGKPSNWKGAEEAKFLNQKRQIETPLDTVNPTGTCLKKEEVSNR